MAKNNSLLSINSFLNDWSAQVSKDVDEAASEAANAIKDNLKRTSPRKTGSYAKGWAVKKQNAAYIVHNKTDYQLTHLLENGHDVVAYGKKVGHVNPKPHIKQAEQLGIEYFEDLIAKKVGGQS